jgi:hypothetical protein
MGSNVIAASEKEAVMPLARVAIGSSYAGVNTAPTNGLIVQGAVGIGTTNPAQTLERWPLAPISSRSTPTSRRR